ncbi:MAG: mechanosensitive ion channel family protein [Bacilli bacterium]
MVLTANDWNGYWESLWQNITKFWLGDIGNGDTSGYIYKFGAALIVLVLGFILIKVICFGLRKAFRLDKKKTKERTAKNFTLSVIKFVLNILLLLWILSILGADLTGLSTIFSSAILAVGLSLQDVVGNFASGIIILSSKPFVAGDYVSIKDAGDGTVTDVRFLATYLKTIDGQVVIIPNKTITNGVIINYSTEPVRRLVLNVTVSYEADISKVKKILTNVIKTDKRVLKDPEVCCVVDSMDTSGVNVSLRCYVPNAVYWDMIYSFNENLVNELNKTKIYPQIKKVEVVQDFERKKK